MTKTWKVRLRVKILSKKESKILSTQIVSNHFFAFSNHGYKFPKSQSEYSFFNPTTLLISCIRCIGISKNSDLRIFLISTFKTSEVLEQKLEFTHQLMGFEFENQKFLVWFNATGKGTTVETFCTDPLIHHRFCVAILRKINYKLNKNYLSSIPEGIKVKLKPDQSLKPDYFNEFVVSEKELKKKSAYESW